MSTPEIVVYHCRQCRRIKNPSLDTFPTSLWPLRRTNGVISGNQSPDKWSRVLLSLLTSQMTHLSSIIAKYGLLFSGMNTEGDEWRNIRRAASEMAQLEAYCCCW